MQQKSQFYPFSLIASQGLGISYSSMKKIGSLFSLEGFGSSGIQFFPNIVTGNLVVRDRMLSIQDAGGPIQIGYTYNSQAESSDQCWYFSHKKITQIPNGKIAIAQEADGHLTTYTFDSQTGLYFAPFGDPKDGRSWMRFDDTAQQWICYQPGKNVTEYYDTAGYLQRSTNKEGQSISYEYDTQQQLEFIRGQSGACYEIRRLDNSVAVYLHIGNMLEQLIQSYQFDEQGRLITSQTTDGYKTEYSYENSANAFSLTSVKQSDQTKLYFTYDSQGKVSNFRLGKNTSYRIDYNAIVIMTDTLNGIMQISVDNNANITSVSRSQGYNPTVSSFDTTAYNYNPEGQLQMRMLPNGGQENFTYDPVSGLLQTHTQPNGQFIEKAYRQSGRKTLLSEEIHYDTDQNVPLVTRYIYDAEYNLTYIFLRFRISPEGRVTEYRPDKNGNIASQRQYLGNVIDLSQIDPHKSFTLTEMLAWISTQDASQITLTEYAYNPRGQIIRTREYANIDPQGNGIVDSSMGETYIFPNLYGNWFRKQVKQDDTSIAVSERTLDSLQRITSETDALQQTTNYDYNDAQGQLEITYPDGRVEIRQKDDKGKVLVSQENASNQTRTTVYGRDTQGRTILMTRPDGQYEYQFYDHQDRLDFTVTSSGIVTAHVYDVKNRVVAKIEYDQAIDPQELFLTYPPKSGVLPEVSKLALLLPAITNQNKDRISYIFTDLSDRPAYSVDAEHYITQYFYDKLNHKIGKIAYSDKLSDDNLLKLKSGENIHLMPDFKKDRAALYFYDNDGYIIGKQDGAGYVTEYTRNNSGKVIQKIRYALKTEINFSLTNFNAMKPLPSLDDAHIYYFRDARNQMIASLTPGDNHEEYSYIQYSYYPTGLLKQKTAYYQKVSEISPVPPPATPDKDQITNYQYDSLERNIQTDLPNQSAKISGYDVMNNMIVQQTKDLKNIGNLAPDYQRTVTAHYDDWNQKDEETNVLGGKITHVYDATGLKLHTTDALNRMTYYFYDIDRRLIASVDPEGIITEKDLNSFSEIIKTIKYANKIPPGEITEGGFLTSQIRELFIVNPEKDQITLFERNQRGEIIQKTDPNGNIATYHYNAFKQCIQENLPVDHSNPTLSIIHQYDSRGLEVLTSQSASNTVPDITIRTYNNLYGKETARLDARGGIYHTEYCTSGNIQKKTQNDGFTEASHAFTYTAFNELETETDSLNNTTSHSYSVSSRTHTINYPVAGVTKTFTQNIFNETVEKTDSLNNTESWTHAFNGKIASHTDALNQTSRINYDLMGQKVSQTHANNSTDSFAYDNSGYLIKQTADITGLGLVTHYERDSFGNAESIIDPRGVMTQHVFDQKNQCIESIQDSALLNLHTQKTYNTQGKLISQIRGDAKALNQYTETCQINGLNRNIGKTVDPEGLNLQTQQQLNFAGDVIAEIDANGHITRKFYNALGKIRFIVDSEGGVSESCYDTEERIFYTRVYANAVDTSRLNNQTDLNTLLMLLTSDAQDTLLYHFYDANGKERYQVNSLGAVGERQYDLALREIKTIKYSTPIDVSLLPSLSTEQLSHLVQTSPDDRITYKIYDHLSQLRFLIDSENYLSEKRYDAGGNIVVRIQYATQFSRLETFAYLSPDEISDRLDADSLRDDLNDRVIYQIFDVFNLPKYSIDSEGTLTQYWHDENHNLIQTAIYIDRILSLTSQTDYDTVLERINHFLINPGTARMTQSQFDTANRKISETDALGYSDKFEKDALGNMLVHTDRAGNNWLYHYDAANRLETETTPEVLISNIQFNQQQLTYTQDTLSIQDTTRYDNFGNKIKIIKSANTDNSRALQCVYNKNNQLIQTQVSNVLIDDDTKPASFANLPVKPVTITSSVIYNVKKLKVAEQDESSNSQFYVYDSEGKLAYQINSLGFVKQNIRNAFGEIIKETAYANKINLDLNLYTQTGISLNIINQPGIIISCPDDRTKTYTRDRRGNITLTQSGPIFYYISKGTDQPQYHLDYAQIRQQYNAFQECFYKTVLLDPYLSVYSQQVYWFDRNGKILAECDAVFNIILHHYDSFGNEIERIEWANPATSPPTPETSLAALELSYSASDQDRYYIYAYDLMGRCTEKTLKSTVIQEIVLDTHNVPSLKNKSPQDLTQIYEYNVIGQKISVTYEDGSKAYLYYDARGLLIAATDVPRQNGSNTTLIPLSYFGNDVFGQRVLTTRFKTGTQTVSIDTLPTPIAIDAEDQTELKLLDNRGLSIITQNAEKTLEAFTYTPTKKLAREWHYLTNHDHKHIDEKRCVYDPADQLISVSLWRDAQSVQTTALQYNLFGNCIAEGPGDNTWPLYRKYDTQNHCWSTNESGIKTISLTNLSGQETVTLQSPTQDLSQIAYTPDQLNNLLNLDFEDLERTETQWDAIGRKVVSTPPTYRQYDPNDPTNIPINVITGGGYPNFGKTSLTWLQPKTINYTLKIKLWPMAKPNQITEPPIKTIGSRSGVDVSAYSTDVYVYEMDYYYTHPVTHEVDERPRYRTTGEIQFDTGNNTNSLMLVVSITHGSTLHLSGNTTGITGIALWQGDIKITELPVQNNTVDLSKFESGIYTVTPIVPGKDNLPGSLRFTLHTYTPSGEPLSTQIDSTFQLLNLYLSIDKDQQDDCREIYAGQFNWQVSEAYQQYPVNLSYTYRPYHDGVNEIVFQGTIQTGEVKNDYGPTEKVEEQQDGMSACNHYYYPSEISRGGFGYFYAVTKIETLSFSLQLTDKDTITIANKLEPSSSSRGTGGPVYGLFTNAFPPVSILYLTPIDSTQLLEYLDVTMDRLAVWKPLNILGKTSQGVYFDVTDMEPYIYPFRYKGQLTFWEASQKLTRKLKASVLENNGKILPLTFQEVIPIKDPGYGFQLLKTTKQEIIDILDSQKENKTIRQQLAPVIYQSLMTGIIKPPDDLWEIFKNSHNKSTHHAEKLKAVQNRMLDYCASVEVYESYVNRLKDNGDLDVQTALITAKQQDFSLFFWEKDPDKPYAVKLVDSYDAGPSASKILHFNLAGTTSFDVLLPNGMTLESLYGKQPKYTFTVEPPAGSPYPSNQFDPSYPVEIQPSRYYRYDAWHNLIQFTDTLGQVTHYTYNDNNQLLSQTQPEVNIMQSDNTLKRSRPITQWGYNIRGFKIGMTDPNGNTQAYLLDPSGQESAQILGDGLTVRKQDFDALGRRISHTDAQSAAWQYHYNHQNSIIKTTYPSGKTTAYTYNELNYRSKDIDQANGQIIYDYDAQQDISTHVSPTGYVTSMVFDRNHQMLMIQYPDGTQMSWTRDYFGIELQHIDLSNVEYTHWRDEKNQVTRRFSNSVRMNYRGQLDIAQPDPLTLYFTSKIINVPAQDISFTYSGGKLMEVVDSAGQTWTAYSYDSENREISIENNLNKINTQFDELGRDVETDDGGARVSTAYDAVGNRRHVIIYCVQNQEIWYSYDAANRVIYDGNTGLNLYYTSGFRTKETNAKGLYRTLTYNSDGVLTDTDCYQIGSSPIHTHRDYTPTGILINYTEGGYYTHTMVVDSEGWTHDDRQMLDGQTVSHTSYSNFSNMGLPGIQNSGYANNIQDHMSNSYTGYEVQQLTSVSGTRTDQYGTSNCSTARKYLNPNGYPAVETGLQDELDPNNKTPVSKLFWTTYDGRILRRTTLNSPPQPITGDNPWGNLSFTQYFQNTHGDIFASYGTDISNPERYSMTMNYLQHCQNRFQSLYQGTKSITNFANQAHAPHLTLPDFVQTYPAPAPQTYVVGSDKETLDNIANSLFGDANFGSAIAGQNGLTPDETLFTGQILQIPQYLPDTNNLNNTTPYDRFVSIIIGSLYPHLDLKQPPPPPPQHHHHSGGFFGGLIGDVVHALVDTVAAVVGGVVGFAVGGPVGASMMAGVFTGLADAAYQGVAVELDWQDHFSLRSAFTAGAEASIATGVLGTGTASVTQALSRISQQQLGDLLMKTATIAVSNQLTEMATGLRSQFDLKAVLTQTGSAMILHPFAPTEKEVLSSLSPLAKNILTTETAAFINTGLYAAVEGQKPDIEATAASALGIGLGDQLGETFKESWQSRDPQATANYQQARQDSANPRPSALSPNPGRSRFGIFNQGNNGPLSNAQQNNTAIAVSNNNPNAPDIVYVIGPDGKPMVTINEVPFPRLDNTGSSNASNFGLASQPSKWEEVKNGIMEGVGFVNGVGDTITYPLFHPISTIEGMAKFAFESGIVAFGADYDGSARVYFQNLGNGITDLYNATYSTDSSTRGYAWGAMFGMGATIPVGAEGLPVIGEMLEVGAAHAMFTPTINPEGAMLRQAAMLEKNVGYNISPSDWFKNYNQIGEFDAYLTDYKAVSDVLGPVRPDQQLNLGLFTYGNQVSFFKATKLALGLGLSNPYQLNDGFVFSKVANINDMMPRVPLKNDQNLNFLGGGQGLPNGSPEIQINPLPTNNWPWRY